MVIDFGDLKQIMMDIIDLHFDHKMCLYDKDPLVNKLAYENVGIITIPVIPTAENLAMHWYQLLQPVFQNQFIKLKHVKVWETPNSTATYEQ